MNKRFKMDLKAKFEKRMIELNEKLEPQFKLSRIDIEDIVNSKTLLAEKESVTQPNYDEVCYFSKLKLIFRFF